MNILVAVASRHGSTYEIAEAIAQELLTTGHLVDVRNARDVSTVEPYDAAIIGIAVYIGAWLAEARQFVARNQAQLADIPVWLFSSGPLGHEQPHPPGDPNHLDELMQITEAREHRIFIGKLDKRNLGLGERLITYMVKAPEGDFRDWQVIRDWAKAIASAVQAPTAPHAGYVDRPVADRYV